MQRKPRDLKCMYGFLFNAPDYQFKWILSTGSAYRISASDPNSIECFPLQDLVGRFREGLAPLSHFREGLAPLGGLGKAWHP